MKERRQNAPQKDAQKPTEAPQAQTAGGRAGRAGRPPAGIGRSLQAPARRVERNLDSQFLKSEIPDSEIRSPEMGFFLLCNITNKIAPRYKNLLGEYFSRLCIINKKGPEMTKNEQIEALKAQLAEQMKGKDPYYEEQRRLIMKMPIELIKFRIPKT